MITCAFRGMMHFREVSVSSRSASDKTKHLKWQDIFFGLNRDNKHYTQLDLPSAKAAKPGKIQSIFIVPQDPLCPIKALQNLARTVPAGPEDPLFSWRDGRGNNGQNHSNGTHQYHTQDPWLGHGLWALLLHWQGILLTLLEDRSRDCAPSRSLEFTHIWSLQ